VGSSRDFMGHIIRKLDIRIKEQGIKEFAKIGATLQGQHIMVNKIFPLILKIKGIDVKAANILKQEMLARDGDVVTSRDTLVKAEGFTDIIILGNEEAIKKLIEKIKMQPFGLKKLSEELNEFLLKLHKVSNKKILRIGGRDFNLGEGGAIIMGILNVTPDSFYDGGYYFEADRAFKRAEEMIGQGAHIIDIGGMSTRPGSKPVNAAEEISRVIPVIENISKKFDVLISIDTYRSEVAKSAVNAGVKIINDISGLSLDENIINVARESKSSAVIMHMQGTPEDMQVKPAYNDVIEEIYEYFFERTNKVLQAGITEDKIIIDPGIGFGKKVEHNCEILSRLSEFTSLGYPVLVGASRKSFIGSLLDGLPAQDRLEGSLAAAVCAFLNGASILRVHDVKETIRAIKIAKNIKNSF
jgi:dihydropteroate synthase